jgi:hypothetical protein
LLLARLIEQVLEGKPGALSRRWISIPQWITACIVSLLGVWIVGFAGTIEPIPHWKTIAVGLLCVAGGAATAGCLLRGRLGRSVGWTWVGIAATYLLTVALVLPALNPVKSSKAFTLIVADKTAASRAAGDQVVAFWLRNIPDGLAYHSKGMYTLDTNDLNVLIDHLRRPNRVWAVVDLAFTTDLPDDVAERMTIEATARISRGDIALVHNGVEP